MVLSDNFICCGWCNNILTLFGTPHRFIVVVNYIVDDGLSSLGTDFVFFKKIKKRITIVIHLIVDDGLSCLGMDFG
jgi:thioredoxin-related protein